MSSDLISIIVPVYKVEKYLNRCVNSILAQTYENFECILIDDGSPDSCPQICDEYAKKDGRIKVIHQKNSGVSAARNAGLDASKGEWIAFVDSDDWIGTNTLEVSLNAAIINRADVVQFNYLPFGDLKELKQPVLVSEGELTITSKSRLPNWCGMIWTRLYSSSLIKENHVKFDESLFFGEDGVFSIELLALSKKTWCISDVLYHYFDREGSAVNSIDEKTIENKAKAANEIEKVLINRNKQNQFYTVIRQKKYGVKHSCIYDLKQANFSLWRKYFPEVNDMFLKQKSISVILFWSIYIHLDIIGILWMKIFRKMRG